MKTEFATLLDATGLSQREFSDFKKLNYDSVRSWYVGRRGCPDGVLSETLALARKNLKKQSIEVEIVARAVADRLKASEG